jgi:hypothetical protein
MCIRRNTGGSLYKPRLYPSLPVQSVYITNVVSSNPDRGEVYSIQYYMIKFVSNWRPVGGFTPPVQLL